MTHDAIPQELRERDQWVCWKVAVVDGRPTKVPIRARSKSGAKADTTNPVTWCSFDIAVKSMERHGHDGIGFVFTKNDPYVGIDVDKTDAKGMYAILGLPTYIEQSPNGGLHVIGRATLPIDSSGKRAGGVEVYQHSRFFTMTGNVIDGAIAPIGDIQPHIDHLWPQLFPEKANITPLPAVQWQATDAEVLDRLETSANREKFHDLYARGTTSGYNGDDSAADLALCSLIAFYTQDMAQIDRIFRDSALMREKWEREDYREMTMGQALQRSEFYTPPINSPEGVTIFRSGDVNTETGEILYAEEEAHVFNTTDLGNALRLRHHHGHRLRYCHEIEKWMVWNGAYWKPDADEEMLRVAADTVRRIYAEADQIEDKDAKKRMKAWASASESHRKLRDMLALARSLSGIPVQLSALDPNPYAVTVLNGTLDLITGILAPHDPAGMATKVVPVDYDPSALCPHWGRFLHDTMAGRSSLVSFLQRAIGYSLTGDITERRMFVCHGGGKNGKTTLVETLSAIMGDYARHSPVDMILAKHGDRGVPNDVARLTGVRFTTCAETNEGDRLDESKIKAITGGDTISSRFMRGEWFDFAPQFKLWFGTNHKPVIRGTDNAIWDRITLIPFDVRVPDDQINPHLKDTLLREAPGILTWIVQGAMAWKQHGLTVPDDVVTATSGYRSEMDSIGSFLEEEMVEDRSGFILAGDLYHAYKVWAEDAGEYVMSQRKVGGRLNERGYDSRLYGVNRARTWFGVRAKTMHDEERIERIETNIRHLP